MTHAVLDDRVPGWRELFDSRRWRMLDDIERVCVNAHARARLGWQARHDFARAVSGLAAGHDYRSILARQVGAKGNHDGDYPDGIFPVEN